MTNNAGRRLRSGGVWLFEQIVLLTLLVVAFIFFHWPSRRWSESRTRAED